MASLSRTPGASTMLNRGAPASTPLAKVTQYWEMMQPKTQSQKKYRVGGVDVDADGMKKLIAIRNKSSLITHHAHRNYCSDGTVQVL